MRERQATTREMARRDRRSGKRARGLMLDELCALAGDNRSHAARLLCERVRGTAPPPRARVRRRTYTSGLLPALRKVWATLDRVCGKRLAAVMAPTIEALERHGDPRGEFAYSLCAVDVASGWTGSRVARNRVRKWTHEALKGIRRQLPFALLGIDSDGGEFINNNLANWCAAERITFTKSRPLHKNDCCFVEQKNWSVVRRETGYGRYDTEAERELIATIYDDLRLFVSFFLPSVKLIAKERTGAKVRKRDDRLTPYRQLRALGALDETESRLEAQYLSLNPAELRRRLTDNERKLMRLCALKMESGGRQVAATG